MHNVLSLCLLFAGAALLCTKHSMQNLLLLANVVKITIAFITHVEDRNLSYGSDHAVTPMELS